MSEPKEETPKWLEELQQRSWEPEVLLSGIVLYGMFKAPGLLDGLLFYFKANIFSTTNDIDNLVGILKLGIYWLIFGLILHLISRGIWVGMVGLSYIFPNGINNERLKFAERFKTKVESIPSFQKIVINLEKVCSSLFSISFMLFMSLVGAYLYIFILVVTPFTIIVWFTGSWNFSQMILARIYVVSILILGFIGLIDFVTLGFFRRYKWFAKIFWPIHRVISALTLAKFYRPIYYAFVSNFNRWVIGLVLIVFVVISFAVFGDVTQQGYSGDTLSRLQFWQNTTNGTTAFSGYYDDQNEELVSVQAHIQSDIIDENVIRLFIAAGIRNVDSIKSYTNYDSLKNATPDLNQAERDLISVTRFYKIYLDDSLVSVPKLFYHYHTTTKQRGYLAYVDISNLQQGAYTLKVGGPPEMYSRMLAQIPFYRDVSNSTESQIKFDKTEGDYMQIKPLLPK